MCEYINLFAEAIGYVLDLIGCLYNTLIRCESDKLSACEP